MNKVLSLAINLDAANSCSNHGKCGEKDACICDRGFDGADCSLVRLAEAGTNANLNQVHTMCKLFLVLTSPNPYASQRSCPFGLAWVDQPLGDLNHDAAISDAEVNVQWANTNVNELWQGDKTDAEANDEAHFYAQCSNRGSCSTSSGECLCFPGYTGSACQRSTCPSDCSGHGVCRTISEIAAN